jgi:hypothetical protein
MRTDNFGVPENGRMRTPDAQEPQSSIIGGRSEMKTDFSLLIGVANLFVFQAIVFIAILVVWYGAESLYSAALAN